jgi:mitogen-activated protein kinase organizer 1
VRFNFGEESNLIISGSIDGKVRIWDLRSRSYDHLQELDDFKDSVTHIDLNAQQILVSCLDKHVRLYDVRFGKMICDFIGEQVTCSTLSKDDQCTLVSTLANKILLFDKQSGELLNEYKGHLNKTYQIENCMNNISSEIYSGSEDGYVYVWDLVGAKVKQKLEHANVKTVHSLSFHPEESKLLSVQEQYVYLWNSIEKRE